MAAASFTVRAESMSAIATISCRSAQDALLTANTYLRLGAACVSIETPGGQASVRIGSMLCSTLPVGVAACEAKARAVVCAQSVRDGSLEAPLLVVQGSGRRRFDLVVVPRWRPGRGLDIGPVKHVLPPLIDGNEGNGGNETDCGQKSQFEHVKAPSPGT